jgi:hypothetical protein
MNGKKVAGIAGGVVAFIVCYYLAFHGVQRIMGGSVEQQIEKMAAELNKTLPKQVDPVTRWDRVEPGPGKAFAYVYTITGELSPQQKTALQSEVRRRALAAPEMRPFFDAGVTVWYKYRDSKGASALEFSVKR